MNGSAWHPAGSVPHASVCCLLQTVTESSINCFLAENVSDSTSTHPTSDTWIERSFFVLANSRITDPFTVSPGRKTCAPSWSSSLNCLGILYNHINLRLVFSIARYSCYPVAAPRGHFYTRTARTAYRYRYSYRYPTRKGSRMPTSGVSRRRAPGSEIIYRHHPDRMPNYTHRKLASFITVDIIIII